MECSHVWFSRKRLSRNVRCKKWSGADVSVNIVIVTESFRVRVGLLARNPTSVLSVHGTDFVSWGTVSLCSVCDQVYGEVSQALRPG